MSGALDDVLVLDVTETFWGSLAAALLGDFGASVIKLESTGPARRCARRRRRRSRAGTSDYFASISPIETNAAWRSTRRARRALDRRGAHFRCRRRRYRQIRVLVERKRSRLRRKSGGERIHYIRPRLRLRVRRGRRGSSGPRRARRRAHRHDADPRSARRAAGLSGPRSDVYERDARVRCGRRVDAPSHYRRRPTCRRVAARRQHVRGEPRPPSVPRDRRRAFSQGDIATRCRQSDERHQLPYERRAVGDAHDARDGSLVASACRDHRPRCERRALCEPRSSLRRTAGSS